MQTPSASDPSFKEFLDKLKEQNNRGFASQLIQLKAERENAGEDNDKREEQLDDVISSLKEVRSAVTGIKIDIDLTPLVNIGENQTKLLEELTKESSLTRKLTEGSVEYDKEAAQYRNTSGRDIESTVSGKTSKDGGFLDFETARDTLSGQGKRVREDNAFSLKPINYTPGKAAAAAVGVKKEKEDKEEVDNFDPSLLGRLKSFMTDGESDKPGYGIFQKPPTEVVKKEREDKVSSPRQENPEADNVTSTGEIQADATKSDLEISKQMLETTKAQLVELKAIKEALAPKTPKELTEQKSTATPSTGGEGEGDGGGGGGLGLGDLLPSGGGIGKALKTAGKGALSLGGKALKFMGGKGGAIAGAALAVGAGAYTAYQGYNAADDSKDAKLKEVQAKVDSGEMKPEEAAAARKEIGNTATVEKSGAVGEGTGMAVGAIAGMKAGAMLGAFGGPIGAGVGAIAGGALGAFAGSSAGKYVGEKVGGGINAVKGFFGGKTDTPGAATKEALAPTPATVKDQAPVASVEPDITFRRSKRDSSTIGGRVITGFEGGYNLHGKKEDVEEADAAYNEFLNAEDDATAEAAASKFKTLAANIQSPEYREKMKRISKEQQERKKAKVDPAVEAQVTGGPGAMIPAVENKPVDNAAPGDATAAALIPGLAKGGPVEDGADYIVGEKGPELFMPFKDGVVLPNDVSKKVVGGKIPLAEGGVALAAPNDDIDHYNKLSKNAKDYQNLRLQLESLDKIRGPKRDNVFEDIHPEVKEKEAKFRKKMADLEKEISPAEKNFVDSALTDRYRPAQSEAELDARGPSLAERYSSKKSNTGNDVNKTSTENIDLSRGANSGGANNTVVSNNVSNNNTTKIVPMKANPRPEYTGSALDRYTSRIAVY